MEIQIIEQKKKLSEKLRVCAYCRVSTEEEEQENSLENQITHYEESIQANPGYELVSIYHDFGISGFKEDRPGFQEMLQAARNHDFNLIITKSVSRFCRNTDTLLKTVRELKELGVGVLFELQHINTLNNSYITMLEQATYVQFIIHPTKLLLGINPCNEGDRDAVRWCNVKDDKRKSRQISCRNLIEKLTDLMGWDPRYYYSMQGFLIQYRGKPVYLFDLKDPSPYVPQHRDPTTGKMLPRVFQYPDGWKNSFGMSVSEHTASTEVNLDENFVPFNEEGF